MGMDKVLTWLDKVVLFLKEEIIPERAKYWLERFEANNAAEIARYKEETAYKYSLVAKHQALTQLILDS